MTPVPTPARARSPAPGQGWSPALTRYADGFDTEFGSNASSMAIAQRSKLL
jgi:hypothetical protein